MDERRRWVTRTAAALAVGAIAVTGCGSSGGGGGGKADAAEPVRIPMLVELSGAVAATGQAALAGAKTAVKVINDDGGIDGRPIRLEVTDTQSNPTVTASAIRTALASKPAAMLTVLATANITPSVPVVASSNTPWVITGPLFAGIDKVPYLFSAASENTTNATASWEAVKHVLGGDAKGKTIYAIAPTPSAANDERMAVFKSLVTKDGGNVVIDREPIAMTTFTSQAANIKRLNPAAVVNFHIDSPGLVIAKALDTVGWNGPIVSGTEANSDIVLSTVTRKDFYVVRESIAPQEGSPLLDAVKAAKVSPQKYLSNLGNSSRGYAAVFAIRAALEKCGLPCPATKFASTMHGLGKITIAMNPLVGPLDFSKGNAGLRSLQVWKWDKADGKAVPEGPVIRV